MPAVSELSDCPLCFGKLLPLSVCQSCSTVEVRDGLGEVGPDIECEDCGASNPTHFACSACNARFPFQDIVKPEGPTCPACRSHVPPRAETCPNCGTILPLVGAGWERFKRRIQGEYGEEDVREVAQIPNVGRERAEALCKAGYNRLWKIQQAPEAEIAKVPGIGPENAAQIREALRFLLVIGQQRTKDEVLSEESECPLCGTVTSLFSTRCHDCGAVFDGEEIDADFRKEVGREEEKGLLAYYDVRLLEHPDDPALLYARACLLLSLGHPAEALSALDATLQVSPGHGRALQAKARALEAAKGLSAAAQILREVVGQPPMEAEPSPEAVSVEAPDAGRPGAATGETVVPGGTEASKEEDAALRSAAEALESLGILAETIDCPECGEPQQPDALICSVCGHRLALEDRVGAAPPDRVPTVEEDQLLDELQRAIVGEDKAPPPPLEPEVSRAVIAGKRSMLVFLSRVPGVSKRAADAVCGFFQDLEQVEHADVVQIAAIPGVAPAEARLVKVAVVRFFTPEKHHDEIEPSRAPPTHDIEPTLPSPVSPPAQPTGRRLSGFEGRRGLVNGQGMVNGRGRVNGLVNGTGFVNGVAIAEFRLPRQSLMPRYIAIGASLLMLFAATAFYLAPGTPPGIVINGEFDDWAAVPEYLGGTPSANPNVQISRTRVASDNSSVFLLIGVEAQEIFSAADWETMYAFLDVDGDETTGYDMGDMGADYAVRVSGSDLGSGSGPEIGESRLLRYDGAGRARDDWSGFVTALSVDASIGTSQKDRMEVSVPRDALEGLSEELMRVRFASDDNAGETSHTLVPIGKDSGALLIEQSPETTTLSGGRQPFLTLTFRSLGDAEIHVEGVQLVMRGGAVFTPDPILPFVVPAGLSTVRTISVDSIGLPAETLVTAIVTDVTIDPPEVPFAIVGPEARAYVTERPAEKVIDGLFEDWSSPQVDMDPGPSPISRRSLNILSRDGNVSGNRMSFYARLGGDALEGGLTPHKPVRPPPEAPGGGPQSPPSGPPPPLVGQDYVRFFVDTDARTPSGFDIDGVSADRMLEVRGRAGRALNASVYQFDGVKWVWESALERGIGGDEIEVGVSLLGTLFNGTQFVAVTADWAGVADRASSTGTRGGAGGGVRSSSGPPVVMDISGNGAFWFRDTNHASETACTHNKVASSTKGSGVAKTITLSTTETACWYVDATTSQTIVAGDWETLLDLSNTGGADYDVRIEIWNKNTDSVDETIQMCLDATSFGDDIQCLATSVAQKTLNSNQVVRLLLAHSFGSGTITIEYDDSDSTGDSRTTLPIPEFSDVAPAALAVVVLLLAVRARRRRQASAR